MLGTWSEHVDELLYDGERVQCRVDLEAATVVVTNDRVLVFTEDGGGSNYRTVERPNVARVSVETDDAPRQLVWATVVLFLGVGLLLAAATYDLADLVAGVDVEGATGITGGALETVETLLTALDLTVLVAGALVALFSTVFFVRYIASRTRRLVLRISGDDDIALPVSDADLEADRTIALEEAIGPGEPSESVTVETDSDSSASDGPADAAGGRANADGRPAANGPDDARPADGERSPVDERSTDRTGVDDPLTDPDESG